MAQLKPFRRIQTTDKDLNLIQDYLQDIFKSLNANPWLFGKPISRVALGAGTNLVQHGLGRNFVSCFMGIPSTVTPGTFGSDIGTFGSNPAPFGTPGETFSGASFALSQTQPDRSNYVAVVASAPVVVDLFVF
jgi:hypothetical protein